MNKQRLALLVAAAIGMLATFMPWINAPFIGSVSGSVGDGWFTFAFFGAVLVTVVQGDRQKKISERSMKGVIVVALMAGAFGIWKIISIKSGTTMSEDNPFSDVIQNAISIGFGLYVVVLASAAIVMLAWKGEKILAEFSKS